MAHAINRADNTRHATLADLLLIRDGEHCEHSAHVNGCEFCLVRLEDVCAAAKGLQQTLLFDADLPVPETAWAAIEKQLSINGVSDEMLNLSRGCSSTSVNESYPLDGASSFIAAQSRVGKPSAWSSINTAIYTLAIAIAFTGVVSLYTFEGQQSARVETQVLQASIQSLMDNSRGLESVLQNMATQSNTFAQADQSAIDRLQWRLMMVDQRINESESSDAVSYEQIKSLWAERIDALTQLNKLYYTNHVVVNDGQF